MDRLIRRSIIAGRVRAPPSLPLAHRAIVAAALAPGQSVISNLPSSQDIDATVSAAISLGADITVQGSVADVFGPEMLSAPAEIGCAQSNTTLKLFLPIASLFESEVKFSGSGSLLKSPLEPYAGYLERLGATCKCPSGFLPLSLRGPITEENMVYQPQLGTQFFSGFLFALPMRHTDTSILLERPFRSSETLEGTLQLLHKCGVEMVADGSMLYIPGSQSFAELDYEVPASRRLSSFLLLAGAVAGRVYVKGAEGFPGLQALLQAFGAHASAVEGGFASSVGVGEAAKLDARKLHGLLPHALVLASLSQKETRIANIDAVHGRQNARMRLMIRELSRMGAKFIEMGSELIITAFGHGNKARRRCRGCHGMCHSCACNPKRNQDNWRRVRGKGIPTLLCRPLFARRDNPLSCTACAAQAFSSFCLSWRYSCLGLLDFAHSALELALEALAPFLEPLPAHSALLLPLPRPCSQ